MLFGGVLKISNTVLFNKFVLIGTWLLVVHTLALEYLDSL